MRTKFLSLALPISCLAVVGCDAGDDEAPALAALADGAAQDSPVMLGDSGHAHDEDLPSEPQAEPAAPTDDLRAAAPDPSAMLPQLCPIAPTPSIERAWKINQKGFLDTNVSFASFFNGPHTVMGWVMPEYTYNAHGPIFAENGGGLYIVGQGDYRTGNGGYKEAGDPVLYVNVGGKAVTYLAPGYKKRQWNHVALVRTAADAQGNYKFQLYVNGQLLTPVKVSDVGGVETIETVPEISFGPASPMPAADAPKGALRFGRRTSNLGTASSRAWQFYGLLDEVAVFSTALTASQINTYRNCGFTGSESTMVAGMTFDLYSAQEPAGPKIQEPIAPVAPTSSFVRRVGVATGSKWNNAADAALFDAAFYVAPSQVSYQLPFPIGEEWKVVQGPDDHDFSHNGYAAFCWDFSRVTSPGQATITASAAGEIVEVIDTHVPDPGAQEGNKIRVKSAENEFLLYLHQQAGSFEQIFMDGFELLFLPQTGPDFWLDVAKGEPMAKTGEVAKHLHLDANDGVLTIPIAFTAYEVKDTSVNPPVWKPVVRGQPKVGEIVRRMQ